jgi:hypothetical protein
MPGWTPDGSAAVPTSDLRAPNEWSLAIGFAVAAAVVIIGPGLYAHVLALRAIVVAAAVAFLGPTIYHAMRHLPWWPKQPPWNARLATLSVATASVIVLAVWLNMLSSR